MMSGRVGFGLMALSLALRARCGTFDRAGAETLVAQGDRVSMSAGAAARRFQKSASEDPVRAGVVLEAFVQDLASGFVAPAPRQYDWQQRADLS